MKRQNSKTPPGKGFSLAQALYFLFCAFFTLLHAESLWSVKTHPEDSAPLWGAEGPVAGLWR